ncbi:hypothetical protein MTO96_029786 [Rhipicephalus appendiculatus]
MAALYALLPAWLQSLLSRASKFLEESTLSSHAPSQPMRAVSNFLPSLPPELWAEIYRRLDIESLLNLAEAVPQWKHLAFNPTVVRSVTFDQGSDERIVKKFLLTKREKLVQEKQIQEVPLALGVPRAAIDELHRSALQSDNRRHQTLLQPPRAVLRQLRRGALRTFPSPV